MNIANSAQVNRNQNGNYSDGCLMARVKNTGGSRSSSYWTCVHNITIIVVSAEKSGDLDTLKKMVFLQPGQEIIYLYYCSP